MMDKLNPKIILGIVLLDVVVAAMGTVYLLFGPETHRSEVVRLTIQTWVLGGAGYVLYRYLQSRETGSG
jgi:hypothetical protein